MSINYFDRRIIKSKKAMKDALVSLMQEKDFKDITISDIVISADLNRGTFYKHYQYKEDILNEIIDEVITNLIESYREPYKNIDMFEVNNLTTSAIKIFDHVSKYANFYSLIFQTDTLNGFERKLCTVLKDLALNDLIDCSPNRSINSELYASYQAYAILGLIIEWVTGGFKYSSSYMAEQLLEILKHNQINSLVKIKQ
ncbi:TetR/AcrR family transcriptional regulator [Neobacillus drentensis]|uniref:TetR/AcrR family transcriptional regulator n=1 Tax=Neobacillus drentensis TaxID=220684 RepID=UPI001F1CD2F6|nr:TetR/AcrR family transcriptional regulator [Neobacillus drentensis]ULT58255.1 TetR/AcrR family transcriptional regulator [Neobacillus drentensis]